MIALWEVKAKWKKYPILFWRLRAPYFNRMIGGFDNHRKTICGKLLNVSNTQITLQLLHTTNVINILRLDIL